MIKKNLFCNCLKFSKKFEKMYKNAKKCRKEKEKQANMKKEGNNKKKQHQKIS